MVEFDWAREGITPDWSVTAAGEKGDVTVIHSSGRASDTLPFIERTASR